MKNNAQHLHLFFENSLITKLFFSFFCFVLLLTSQNILAGPNRHFDLPQLQTRAQELSLSEHPQWLSLLHYNQGGSLRSRKASYVESDEFFLSPNGKRDPQKELSANINLLFSASHEYRCRFVARFHWLHSQLIQPNDTAASGYKVYLNECKDFAKLINNLNVDSATLIFPSAYLNSPSSIFGHTLLRLDNKKTDDGAEILNWAINYGADIPDEDSTIAFAINGISGKYPGKYFVVPYAQKIKEYGHMENRDIWEYPLNLSASEVNFLVEHLWEIREVEFDYFFFDENCSFRLLELVDLVRPNLALAKKRRLTEIPLNSVKSLNDAQLIKEGIFRPSKSRELSYIFSLMNKEEQRLAIKLSNTSIDLNSGAFSSLDKEKQFIVLQGAYQYLRYQQSQETRQAKKAKLSLALLKSISQLPQKSKQLNLVAPSIQDIRLSHDSHRLSLGGGVFKNQARKNLTNPLMTQERNFMNLQGRMTYHDLLDNGYGYFQGAHVVALEIDAYKFPDFPWKINTLKLAEIISLSPRSKIVKPLSWVASLRAERYSEGNQHLSTILEAGSGLAWENFGVLHYQLIIPRIEINPSFSNYEFFDQIQIPERNAKGNLLSKHADLGLTYRLGFLGKSPVGSYQLQYDALRLYNHELKHLWSLSQHIETSKNTGLRLQGTLFKQSIKKDAQLSLSFHYYL